MKGRSGEGLLVDLGSLGNLCGSELSDRVNQAANAAGRPTTMYTPLPRPIEVGGLGIGTPCATHRSFHHIAMATGREAVYSAPVLPRSGTLASPGQHSLRKLRTLLNCFNGRMYFVGPGGYHLKFSPGSELHQLEELHAGHLMLPCTQFKPCNEVTGQVLLAERETTSTASVIETAGTTPRPRM